MTTNTLIIVNAILGAAATYGLVWLLAFGISSDRTVRERQVRPLRRTSHDRLAA